MKKLKKRKARHSVFDAKMADRKKQDPYSDDDSVDDSSDEEADEVDKKVLAMSISN